MTGNQESGEISVVRERVEHAHQRIDTMSSDIGSMKGDIGEIRGSLASMKNDMHRVADHVTAKGASSGELMKTVRVLIVAAAVMGLAWVGFSNFGMQTSETKIEANR